MSYAAQFAPASKRWKKDLPSEEMLQRNATTIKTCFQGQLEHGLKREGIRRLSAELKLGMELSYCVHEKQFTLVITDSLGLIEGFFKKPPAEYESVALVDGIQVSTYIFQTSKIDTLLDYVDTMLMDGFKTRQQGIEGWGIN